jgi:hypothetical protein
MIWIWVCLQSPICVGGTGRFPEIKGKGTHRNERLGALRTGDYVYIDTTGRCIVP